MIEALSIRESEVLEKTAWGQSAKEVADELFISKSTVQNHLRRIKEKLNLQKATELTAYYFCTHFRLSEELKQRIIAVAFILILAPYTFSKGDVLRAKRVRRRIDTEYIIEL